MQFVSPTEVSGRPRCRRVRKADSGASDAGSEALRVPSFPASQREGMARPAWLRPLN
jgi:hypothetical protein